MADLAPELRARVDAVKARLPIAAEIEAGGVKLSGSGSARNRRGRCPFHEGNSASFSVQGEKKFAHCFGCGWHGDVIAYLRDSLGLEWIDALREAEIRAGIVEGTGAKGNGPVRRERAPPARPARADTPPVSPVEMARALWRMAVPDLAAVRRYFCGRGVPAAVLSGARLADFRYFDRTPVMQWKAGALPGSVLHAPAIMALVREPLAEGGAVAEWRPVALHVTYLNPAGDGTMVRRKPWAVADDPDPLFPKRRMLGPVGRGCVLLGSYRPDARLWVGEGNETVLSAMALGEAGPADLGIAALSLDNLQGHALKWRDGVWPLHRIEPDPERPCFRLPGHLGAVVGLIDSDMAPLRNQRVVERKGGPVVARAITGAERARICGELVVKGWRALALGDVRAMRAPQGMDFNDLAASRKGVAA